VGLNYQEVQRTERNNGKTLYNSDLITGPLCLNCYNSFNTNRVYCPSAMSQEVCRHDGCKGTINNGPKASDRPDTLTWHSCTECGQLYEYDKVNETLRVNL